LLPGGRREWAYGRECYFPLWQDWERFFGLPDAYDRDYEVHPDDLKRVMMNRHNLDENDVKFGLWASDPEFARVISEVQQWRR